jgi:hypothetical protein
MLIRSFVYKGRNVVGVSGPGVAPLLLVEMCWDASLMYAKVTIEGSPKPA